MNVSLVTIPLAIVVSLLLGKVAWPRAKTAVGRTRVAVGLFVLTAALLVSALVALFEAKRAEIGVLAQEARTLAAVRALPADGPVAVVGRVSGQNAIRSRNFAALAECQGDRCEENYPDTLLVDVADGVVRVEDDDYEDVGWRAEEWGGHVTRSLAIGDAVVVVGEAKGGEPTLEEAYVVYAGPNPATTYREHAQMRQRLAFAALVLDLAIGLVLFVLAIVAIVRRHALETLPATTATAAQGPGDANRS